MARQILSETPVGRKVRLVAIDGGRQLVRRLLSLGLSVGAAYRCDGQFDGDR